MSLAGPGSHCWASPPRRPGRPAWPQQEDRWRACGAGWAPGRSRALRREGEEGRVGDSAAQGRAGETLGHSRQSPEHSVLLAPDRNPSLCTTTFFIT